VNKDYDSSIFSGGVAICHVYFRFCRWRHVCPSSAISSYAKVVYSSWLTKRKHGFDTAWVQRTLKVVHQKGAPGIKSAIYHCFVAVVYRMSGYRRCCVDNAIFVLACIFIVTTLTVCTARKTSSQGHLEVTDVTGSSQVPGDRAASDDWPEGVLVRIRREASAVQHAAGQETRGNLPNPDARSTLSYYYFFLPRYFIPRVWDIKQSVWCLERLQWGLGNCESVRQADCVETLDCRGDQLVQECRFTRVGGAQRCSPANLGDIIIIIRLSLFTTNGTNNKKYIYNIQLKRKTNYPNLTISNIGLYNSWPFLINTNITLLLYYYYNYLLTVLVGKVRQSVASVRLSVCLSVYFHFCFEPTGY